MSNNTPNREEMLKLLQESIQLITFTKADGTLRDLKGTLRSDLLPAAVSKSETPHNANLESDTIRVYDLEKAAWRSFKLSKVISTLTSNE